MEQYLMDTNVIIDYLGKKLPITAIPFMNSVMDYQPTISVITKIEVLGFNAPAKHQLLLSNFINDLTLLYLTNDVIETTIEIRKKYKTKLPDAIIGATALVNNLILITRNISDFKNIQNLKVIDPHTI